MDSSDTTFNNDAFDLTTDLPDFSELDVIDEPGDFTDPAGTENAVSEEEISLDEFIEGGIFETGPDEDKIREKLAEAPASQKKGKAAAAAEEAAAPAAAPEEAPAAETPAKRRPKISIDVDVE